MFYVDFIQYARSLKSSGIIGEACEMAARSYTSNRTVKAVKPAGKVDAYLTYTDSNGKRHTLSIEYKTGCGRIDNIGRPDYVAYWPEPLDDIAVEDGFVMFTFEQWNEFLNGYTGRGKLTNVRKDGETHIQSFRGLLSGARPSASLPIANYIYDTCATRPTLGELVHQLRK